MSVVITAYPYLELYDKEKIAISGESTLVFMNTGTRSAAIVDVSVGVNQNLADPNGSCETPTDTFKTSFETLILKPNDTVLKRLKLERDTFDQDQTIQQDKILFPVRETDPANDGYFIYTAVDLCLLFRIVAPSASDKRAHVHLGTMIASKPPHMTVVNFSDLSKPQTLVSHTATIFDEWPSTVRKWWRRIRNKPESPDEELEFSKPWW